MDNLETTNEEFTDTLDTSLDYVSRNNVHDIEKNNTEHRSKRKIQPPQRCSDCDYNACYRHKNIYKMIQFQLEKLQLKTNMQHL